jgi:predicted AlkP superfamily pyrophosphatase or phosphodiesterase
MNTLCGIMIGFIRNSLVAVAAGCVALAAPAAPQAQHVFIISIDGANPQVLQRSEMPVVKKLAKEAAHTWVARTIIPSITLPSHTSMLTGVEMNKHKITWNNMSPTSGVVRVPTVFTVAKAAGLSTAMFVGKEKLWHLAPPGTVDEFSFNRAASLASSITDRGGSVIKTDGHVFAQDVAADAAAYILKHKPQLCFIHFAEPDTVGHQYGWGSPEQMRVLADTDAAIAQVIKAIRKAGLARKSVVIITSDHGGHERGHSKSTLADVQIPWIAWGKGVNKGHEIAAPVQTCDTAATALWLLGLQAPPMDGVPVKSAFK